MRKSRPAICGLTLLLLLPCFWLPQIPSADLASHTYNAWLATLVQRGEIDGLYFAPQWTNFLFDWFLARILPIAGKSAAEGVAAAICVLVLFSGGAALLANATRRVPWHLLGSLAMLCYGFVFHMGLFNFQLSLGICVWGLALIWKRPVRRWIAAAPLPAIAVAAHPLPVAWFLAVALYLGLARTVAAQNRFWLAASAVFGILFLRLGIQLTMPSSWEPFQALLVTGADQALVFDRRYLWITGLWLALWGYLLIALLSSRGWAKISRSIPFQLVCLTAFAIFLLPTRLLPPGHSTALSLIAERMSLAQGILVTLLLARLPPSAGRTAAHAALTGLFFVMLYGSQSSLAGLERAVEESVSRLPRGSRVLSGLCWPESRFNSAYHLVDRACVGHCFSFGNFEAASGHFRLRARPGNRFAVANIGQAYAYEYEEFIFRPADVAEFRIEGRPGSKPRTRKLEPGMRIRPPCSLPRPETP